MKIGLIKKRLYSFSEKEVREKLGIGEKEELKEADIINLSGRLEIQTDEVVENE